jgi:hypothetical protein
MSRERRSHGAINQINLTPKKATRKCKNHTKPQEISLAAWTKERSLAADMQILLDDRITELRRRGAQW